MSDSEPSPLLAAYLERRADLIRYFRARLRSEDAAQELVQEIYFKIARRPGEADPAEAIANPSAYLFRLGSNLMLDRLKQARRTERREQAYGELHAAAGGETLDEAPGAEDALAARQRLQAVVETVRELPPNVRRAFYLHKVEGLSHAETAAAMGVSRSSVEKYLMASLKAVIARVGRSS